MELNDSNVSNLIYQNRNTQIDGSNHGWHILSLLSWIIFICTIWNSYLNRTFISTNFFEYFLSFQVEEFNCIMVKGESIWLILFTFLISLLGFSTYLIFTTLKKNQNLYDGMLGKSSRFHFIPLLFISVLFILTNNAKTYTLSEKDLVNDFNYNKMLLIYNIILPL